MADGPDHGEPDLQMLSNAVWGVGGRTGDIGMTDLFINIAFFVFTAAFGIASYREGDYKFSCWFSFLAGTYLIWAVHILKVPQ